jgi:hypothetical protein
VCQYRTFSTQNGAFLAHATQRQHEGRFLELTMLPAERFALAAGVAQPRAVTESLFEGL